jgi:hypothetical protein
MMMREQKGVDFAHAVPLESLGADRSVDEQGVLSGNEGVSRGRTRRAIDSGRDGRPGVFHFVILDLLLGNPNDSDEHAHAEENAKVTAFHEVTFVNSRLR